MSTRHQHGWIKACTGSFKTGHMNMEWNWNSPSKLDIIIWSGTGTPYLDQIPLATVPLLSIHISLQALDEPASVNLASTLNLKLLKPSEGSLTRLTQKVIKLLCQLLSQYFPLFWGQKLCILGFIRLAHPYYTRHQLFSHSCKLKQEVLSGLWHNSVHH